MLIIKYNISQQLRKYNDKKPWVFDIAVLMVQNSYKLNQYVTPVCLPSQNFIIMNGLGVISGFGLTEVCYQNDV